MIKIIVDDGKCTVLWGERDAMQEAADGACGSLEILLEKQDYETVGQNKKLREAFDREFENWARKNRLEGVIKNHAKNDD